MSWLRLQRDVSSPQTNREVSYTFGEDSFIRRFFSECKEGGVSAWRISTGYWHCSLQNRIVYRVHQCHDADGPMLAPDFILGDDKRTVPLDYCAAAYQELLLFADSAKKDGRHYVDGCWYYELPESCWIIDPMITHFVDVFIDINEGKVVGGTRNRESVVMIRNVTKIDAHNNHLHLTPNPSTICHHNRDGHGSGCHSHR